MNIVAATVGFTLVAGCSGPTPAAQEANFQTIALPDWRAVWEKRPARL
jgi:hypothetical protein